jgi:nucleoside-specific outer membrane channel protein Tsx
MLVVALLAHLNICCDKTRFDLFRYVVSSFFVGDSEHKPLVNDFNVELVVRDSIGKVSFGAFPVL